VRIAILELGIPPRTIGGAEIQAWELARRLASHHHVTLIVRRKHGEFARESRENVDILRVRIAGAPFRLISHVLNCLWALWRMRRELDAVISFRAYPNGIVTSLFHRLTRIPSYVSVRGLDWYDVRKSRWGRACLRFAMTAHTRVLVQSSAIARDVSAALPAIRPPRVLPNGIATTSRRARGQAVLFVGGLNRHKGIHVLIEAVRRLDGLPLVIVGDGPERDRLEQQADGLDVSFLGRVEPHRVLEIMVDQGRVLVLPTVTSEAYPNVVLQAMSVRLPVIATDVPGGVPDLLGHDERGLLVPPDDPIMLAKAIRRVNDDEALRDTLAGAALRHVELHAWPRTVSAWEAVLESYRAEKKGARRARGMRIFTAYNMKTRGGAALVWQRLPRRAAELHATVVYATPYPLCGKSPHTEFARCPSPHGAVGNVLYMAWLLALCTFRWWPRRGDVGLSQGILYTLPMLPLRWKGARILTVVHGDYFEELRRRHVARWVRRMARLLYEPMYHKAARLLPVSADLARRLQERHDVPAANIEIVHNAIPAIESTSADVLRALRSRLHLNPEAMLLVYVGGLHPIKRVDRFLSLVAAISTRRPAEALVVGDGPLRRDLERLARELNIAQNVHFLGWQTDPQPYMELADLMVLCSDYEGCPTVLMEGMALRVPMVGSNVGGIPEILGDSRLLFDPADPAALPHQVEALLDQDGRVAPWVREQLKRQAHHFDIPWEKRIVDVCRRVAAV